MRNLYNKLNMFNINMEFVKDIYYKGTFLDGIVIYFPNGETFQVFKDEENKYSLINENLAVIIISEYFKADEEFIDDNFELYVSSGDIIL